VSYISLCMHGRMDRRCAREQPRHCDMRVYVCMCVYEFDVWVNFSVMYLSVCEREREFQCHVFL
jgi:hypothetical protein